MNQNQLLMMLVFGGQIFGDQGRGARVVKRALSSTLGPMAAILIARKELKQQDETHKQIIKEVVASGIRDEDTLKAKLPALHAVFLGLPADMRDDIFPRPPAGGTRSPDGSRKAERAAA